MVTPTEPCADPYGRVLCPVMVGRDDEFARLSAMWAAPSSVAAVRAPAGLGKSRLVREFTAWARARGATVLAGRCAATTIDIPLRALREALLGAARAGLRPGEELTPFLPALGMLVPEWAPPVAAVDPNMIVTAEGVLRFLAGLARADRPAVLVVEDLHWADPETAALLDYVAENCAIHPIMLLVTLRTGEEGPGPTLVGDLVARRAATPIDLRPLRAEEVERMIAACLGGDQAPPRLAASIGQRSDGVPFFVEEMLSTVAGSPHGTTLAVPDSVGAAVEQRLARLSDGTAALVRHAALLGRQFEYALAAAATGADPERVPVQLREAVRAQLLDVDGAGFRFRHALTVDAVVGGMLPGEREQAAGRLLASLYQLDPDLTGDHCQLAANLAEQAGDEGRATGLLLESARRAAADGSLATAEALARRAHDGRPREADLCLLDVLTLAGHPDRVIETGQRLLASATDPVEMAEVRLTMARAAIAAGRWGDADEHVSAARAASAQDRGRLARIDAVAAAVMMGRGDVEGALVLARRVLADGEATAQAAVQCEAWEVVGRAERGRDIDAAAVAFENAHQIATDHRLAVWRIRAMQELGTIDMFQTLATGRLERARAEALEAGAVATAALVDLQLAALYNERGEPAPALAAALRCEDASRRFGLSTLAMSLSQQAMAHARSGHRADMERAAAAARATEQDVLNVDISLHGNATAVYEVGRRDLRAAAAALDRSMDGIRRSGGVAYPFPGLWALIRTVLDEGGPRARDEVRALPFDTPMSRYLLAGADAVAAGQVGDRSEAEALFTAADGALACYEGGFRQGLLRLLCAPCAFRDGWGEPATWLREAHATFAVAELSPLAAACRAALREVGEPAPRAPRGDAGRARVPPKLAALGLTAREVDVLVQLAAGRSNREIADALVLSVRTVEKHVERVLMKAGRPRGGLADLAAKATPAPRT